MAAQRSGSRLPSWWPIALGAFVLFAALTWALLTREGEAPAPVTEADSASRAEDAERTAESDPALRGGIAAFERSVAAQVRPVAAQPLRGGVRIELERVVWNEPSGARFLTATHASGLLDASALAGGAIVVQNVELRNADVRLSKPAEGAAWNYERLFTEDADRDGPGRLFALRDVRIVNSRAVIELPDGTYVLRDADARLTLAEFTTPGDRERRVNVSALTGMLTLPDTAAPVRVALTDARFTLGDERIGFVVERAGWGDGRLADIRGTWAFAQGTSGIRATGRVESVNLADARGFAPSLPAEGTASFAFELTPIGNARLRIQVHDLEAHTGGSSVFGSLSAVIGGPRAQIGALDLRLDPLRLELVERFTGDTLPYAGALRGTVRGPPTALRFDLVADLTAKRTRESFTTRLVGSAALTEGGFGLASMDAHLEDVPLAALSIVIPGLPLDGRVSGRVRLTGPPDQAPMEVDVRLEVANGSVTLLGFVDLRGAAPSYDLRGRLIGVNLDALLQPEVPPVSLTAAFAARGSGSFKLETAEMRFELFGRFSGWRTGPRDTVGVRLRFARGTLELDTLTARAGPISVAAGGAWHLLEPASGGLAYLVEVRSLSEIAPFVQTADSAGARPAVIAGGSIRAVGAVSGPLAEVRLGGTITGRDFRYGEWAARRVQGEYAYLPGEPYPDADLKLTAQDVRTANVGSFDALAIEGRLSDQNFRITLDGTRPEGRKVELAADGRLDPEAGSRAVLRRLELDLRDQRWALADTAVVSWGGPGLAISNLVVRQVNGAGEMRANGRIPPRGNSDLDLAVRSLPIGDLIQLIGLRETPNVTGMLTADANVRGTSGSPDIRATFRLDQGTLNDVPLAQANGTLRYASGHAAVEAAMRLQDGGSLIADVALPASITLDVPPTFVLDTLGAMRGRLTATRLALATFAELHPQVEDARGTIDGTVELSGSLAEPLVNGALTLDRGQMTIVALDQRFTEISGRVLLDGRLVTLERLRARSDGWLEASGSLSLTDIDDPVVDMTVTLRDFEPIGAEDVDGAGFSGSLEIAGPVSALVAGGRLEVEDGTIPVGRFVRDERILTEEVAELTAVSDTSDASVLPPAGPSWFESLRLDGIVVAVREGVWFTTDDMRARLSGDLTIYKEADDVRIFGGLEGNQGTFAVSVGALLVRRFEIQRANVRFFGMPNPDPALDVIASRKIIDQQGGQFEVLVNVTGTISTPSIALTTPEGATLPESELLNVLVFGEATSSLGGSGITGIPGEPLVTDIIYSGVADWAGMELEEALVEEVGVPVDYFLIRTPAGQLNPSFVLGKQLTNDLFLTFESGVGFSPGIGLDWQIDRQWSLELNLEPTRSVRYFRGIQVPGFDPARNDRQISIDLRRRWTY